MTTVNKNFKVKNGLQIDPLTIPGYLINDASGIVSSVPTSLSLGSYVKNDTGSTLYKGQVVYISGATGANSLVSLASASAESTSSKTLGLLYQDLNTGDSGYVITNGELIGVDTSAYTEGAALWLSTTAGAFSSTKVSAPNHLVYIGVVTRSHAIVGEIAVKIQNGYELDELHNVLITTPSDGQVLKYNSGLWINSTASTSGGMNISDTIPSSPIVGDTWYDSLNGKTYVYYDSYWVQQAPKRLTLQTSSGSYGTAYGIITCGTSLNDSSTSLASVVGVTIQTLYGGSAVDF